MKRISSHFQAIALIAAFCTPACAIAQAKITPYDMALVKSASNAHEATAVNNGALKIKSRAAIANRRISVLITLDDGYSADMLAAAGMEISGQIKQHVYGTVSIDLIEQLAATEGVRQFAISRTRSLVNDKARSACHADDVQTGAGLSKSYNGEGVIVGITDAGLDANHVAFVDNNGRNRVKRLWQYVSDNPRSYDEENIGNFTTDDRNESHGTHVLATAAGSCSTTDNGNDYHGVAPEADLAIMCGNSDDASILDGISRMIGYAESEGKPLVINMSLGDNFGPHDGTDTFTAALNELAANENTTIFVAAGNEGDRNLAIVTELTEGSTTVKTLLNSNDYTSQYYPMASNTSQGIGYIDVWSDDERPLKVYLDIINTFTPASPIYSLELSEKPQYIGQGTAWYQFLNGQPSSNATFNKYYTNGFIGGYAEVNQSNNRFNATMAVYLDAVQSTYYSTFVAIRVEGEPGQKVYIYNDGYGLDFESRNIKGYSNATANGTISNMACGKNTISVGSFNTRSGSLVGDVGDISSFSSYGILNDGRILPDITAPGSHIYSARNQYLSRNMDYYYPKVDSTTDKNSQKTYHWTGMDGTSMATPFATGVGALLLSVNPSLQTEDIRHILKQSAIPPAMESAQWGAGKINAFEAVKLAENYQNSINGVLEGPRAETSVMPSGTNIWQIHAPSEDQINITVTNLCGQVVEKLAGANDLSINLNSYPAGIYVITVEGKKSYHSEKIAVK